MALTKTHNRMIEGTSVNVLDFGADRLGSSTSHAQIQDAIDHASANGQAVYIPGGEYKLADTIDIPSNMTLYGDGPNTRLFRDTSVATFDMIEVQNKAHIALKDFLLDGVTKLDNGSAANRYCGIRVHQGGSGSQPNDIEIIGIHVNNTTSGEQQPEANRAGILLEDCYDVRVSRCKFYNNRGAGILISQIGSYDINQRTDPPYQTKEIQITQCWGKGEVYPFDSSFPNGFGSMITGNQFQNMIVSDCFADGFGFTNISLNGQDTTIQNCMSINSPYSGITLGHPSKGSRPTNIVCDGNVVRNNLQSGINTTCAKNLVISNNVTEGNALTSGGEIEIRWEAFKDVAGQTAQYTISGNSLHNGKRNGILLEAGSDTQIIGNSIHNCGSGGNEGHGIYFQRKNAVAPLPSTDTDNNQDEAGRVVIVDNKITNNADHGINLELGLTVFISGNTIHDNGERGIQLGQFDQTATMEATVKNNHLKDNGSGTRSAIYASTTAANSGSVNAVCMNNTIYSSAIATKQGMGITAVGALSDIQVYENWFSTGYVGTLNTNFGSRNTRAFNAFDSGTISSSNRLLTP